MPDQLIKQTNRRDQLFVNLLRSIVHTPLGIKVLSLTRWLYHYNPQDWLDVNYLTIRLPRLPIEFHEYRLVQISDLHLGTWLSRSNWLHAIEKANATNPDLVVLTGDFVTYDPEKFLDDLQAGLCRLQARDGVLATLGNHDHWTDPALVRTSLKACNITVLENQVVAISRSAAQLFIAGVDDVMVGKDDLHAVLSAIPPHQACILLVHEPDFADQSSITGCFDLQLSGHSHGGQINLPGLRSLYLPSLGRKYPSGLQRVNGMLLYTNSGLGTAELQFRYNSRPEIAVFTLLSVRSSTHADSF